MRRIIDMTGQRFGKLTVRGRAEDRNGKIMWLCDCDCGGQTIRDRGALKSKGHQLKSCGCSLGRRVRHGKTETPTFVIWQAMKQRCYNPKHDYYRRYGGRGITVCERWHTFDNFLADMGERPGPHLSIERDDNDGNYEPGNCRWATRSEQALNRCPK